MPLTTLLNGPKGRLAQAIAATATELGVAVGSSVDTGDDLSAGFARCNVVVEFSSPDATARLLELAVAQRKPVVIGATGHEPGEKKRLLATAAQVPCVWTGNFS